MKLFLYEPDPEKGKLVSDKLQEHNYEVHWAKHYDEALKKGDSNIYDVNMIDIDGKEKKGLDLIKRYCSTTRGPLCVALYSKQDTSVGFEASRLGSQKIYEITHGGLDQLNHVLKDYEAYVMSPRIFEHHSKKYQDCINALEQLINHHKPVLLIGESGVGKSFLAEHVHKEGTDSNFKYEEVLCNKLKGEYAMEEFLGVMRGFRPGVTKARIGIVGSAQDKGLLYMEKIQELPSQFYDVLASILELGNYKRVGEDNSRTFNAHFIASCLSVEDLDKMNMDRRLFDLLRHNVIEVPPLRECQEDIIPNAEMLIKEFCFKGGREEPTLSDGAKILLYTYSWPGNYRELKEVIERAVLSCKDGVIQDSDIKFSSNVEELPTDKKGLVIYYLRKFNGSKKKTADAIHKSRPTLDAWLKEWGIDAADFKFKKSKKKKSDK